MKLIASKVAVINLAIKPDIYLATGHLPDASGRALPPDQSSATNLPTRPVASKSSQPIYPARPGGTRYFAPAWRVNLPFVSRYPM